MGNNNEQAQIDFSIPSVIDTNVLMEYPEILEHIEMPILPIEVVEELDNIKNKWDSRAWKAREALRRIKMHKKKIQVDFSDRETALQAIEDKELRLDPQKVDNLIILSAIQMGAPLITNDCAMSLKAEELNKVPVFEYHAHRELTHGWKEITLSEAEKDCFFADIDIRTQKCKKEEGNEEDNSIMRIYESTKGSAFEDLVLGLPLNQYVILYNDDGSVMDVVKHVLLQDRTPEKKMLPKVVSIQDRVRTFSSKAIPMKVRPLDPYQKCAVESLIKDPFTVLTGKAGTGKTLLSLAYAFWAIEHRHYDQLMIFVNPTKTRGSSELGYYKGDIMEKLMQNSIGNILKSKMTAELLNSYIEQQKVQILPISDIRGVEIKKNQILYMPEMQNSTIDMAKLCIQRAAEGAKIIAEGDVATQVDKMEFENGMNGLQRYIDIFTGDNSFSHVHLPIIHRSHLAELAEMM